LQAKSFGKGDPAYIRKNSIQKACRQHINHPRLGDRAYYNVTDFISFSFFRNPEWAGGANLGVKSLAGGGLLEAGFKICSSRLDSNAVCEVFLIN
jgi:hypothetical protein